MPKISKATLIKKKIEGYDELQKGLIRILRTSNVPKSAIANKIGLAESQFYRIINGECNAKPEHIIASFRAIIELCNYQFADIVKPEKTNVE